MRPHADMPVTQILDNARYQRCKDVAVHAATRDIGLLYLHACSLISIVTQPM